MISFVYNGAKTTSYIGNQTVTDPTPEGYFKAKDYENLPKDKPNATIAVCIDWAEATAAQQAAMGDMVQVYDAEDQKWRPLCK